MTLLDSESATARRSIEASQAIKAANDKKIDLARENFWSYRKIMRPEMKWNWYVEQVAIELQNFYTAFTRGERPILVLTAPPQHGKSWSAEDFISWLAGKNPDLNIVFASYSDDLGVRTNLRLQRRMMSETYRRTFADTVVGSYGWQCNSSWIQFANRSGEFRNTTIDGAITGMGFHIGVIDDPIKGRAEAQSKNTRDRVWNWFTDDFGPRFDQNSALLFLMTRWHVDDPIGRLMERDPNVRILKFPAIALQDDYGKNRSGQRVLRRRKGQALFPALKDYDFLMRQKMIMSSASWEAEYQQNPITVGGGVFPIENLKTLPYFDPKMIKKSVRYIDNAGTESGSGSQTAGVLMHKMKDGTFCISHLAAGRLSVLKREQKLKFRAANDKQRFRVTPYEVGVERSQGQVERSPQRPRSVTLLGSRSLAEQSFEGYDRRCGWCIQSVDWWLPIFIGRTG